jgi:cyclophilin family peptidyl-prolyl cis-trans isomerase
VRTSRGEIVLALEAGSRTAGNFAQLARHGYFDGLTWHRVVPDFVAQGGDPRGDGSGGPGYTIPCEIGEQRYLRGAVGMALSGKDTGGSQFFITLSAQPHLEGRYTVFAQVQSGMEAADQLVEGDLIESITIE